MIPPSIVELLQTGVSVVVGTRDAALMPECTRAWGIQVGKDRASVTIFLTEAISQQTLRNLKDNGRIAVSCTRPTDHVACQVKGTVRKIRPATKREAEQSRAWHREFTGELVAIGVPAALCEAWITEPTLAVEIDVTEVYHQTPGPGTGERV
jgi:predicted pyridoxine 5'-phosphate oxidase superfamily flavin-nucleotide-binding protein